VLRCEFGFLAMAVILRLHYFVFLALLIAAAVEGKKDLYEVCMHSVLVMPVF
jgi:hypothetical protein